MNWINDVDIDIFSRVKAQGKAALRKNYPNIFFTNENKTDDKATFPTVFLQNLGGNELGRDLEGTKIHAFLATYQVDVSTVGKYGMQDAKVVMTQVVKTMKSMCFEVMGLPTYRQSGDVYVGTARFRRTISSGDVI